MRNQAEESRLRRQHNQPAVEELIAFLLEEVQRWEGNASHGELPFRLVFENGYVRLMDVRGERFKPDTIFKLRERGA